VSVIHIIKLIIIFRKLTGVGHEPTIYKWQIPVYSLHTGGCTKVSYKCRNNGYEWGKATESNI